MTEVTYCKNHPKVETTLRCNRCEEPMCTKCAVHTPTGYRCIDCVKEQKKVFETAYWRDYFSGFITAAILSIIASIIVEYLSGWFYGIGVLFFAPFAASIIISGVKIVTGHRRSRKLFMTITFGVFVGGASILLDGLTTLFLKYSYPEYVGPFSIWWLLPVIWVAVYLVIAIPAVYAGLSGFRLK